MMLLGRSVGQLQGAKQITLVFFRQEALRQLAPEESSQEREDQQERHGESNLADENAAPFDVAIRRATKPFVKPRKEFSEQSSGLFLRPE